MDSAQLVPPTWAAKTPLEDANRARAAEEIEKRIKKCFSKRNGAPRSYSLAELVSPVEKLKVRARASSHPASRAERRPLEQTGQGAPRTKTRRVCSSEGSARTKRVAAAGFSAAVRAAMNIDV